MAGITKTQAETMLAEAITNLSAVRLSEEYRVGNSMVKRSMLKDANDDVTHWNGMTIRLSRTSTSPRARQFIPED